MGPRAPPVPPLLTRDVVAVRVADVVFGALRSGAFRAAEAGVVRVIAGFGVAAPAPLRAATGS